MFQAAGFCYDTIYNCNWVATRWHLFSTHIHKQYRKRHKTNNTKNTKIHRTTQKIHRATQQLGRVRAMPRLCRFYPGIYLTTEEKAWKNLSHASHFTKYVLLLYEKPMVDE